MRTEDIDAVMGLAGLARARLRDDLALAGSPERAVDRAAVEDAAGTVWVVNKHDLGQAPRKQEIAAAAAYFSRRVPEVRSYLAFAPGSFVAEHGGAAWQISPFIEGVGLDRPAFAYEGWRGEALAGLLLRFRRAALESPGPPAGSGELSLAAFVRDLAGKLSARRRPVFERVYPAILRLERALFPGLDRVPTAFSHGDFHPLNVIWSAAGINGLIDLEFCGPRPEIYDAALLVGCVGMEEPRSLAGELVGRFVGRLRAEAGYSNEAWEAFFDLVLALRFAWLSDWLRRDDREMVDLEAVYIGLLLTNRESLEKDWARA